MPFCFPFGTKQPGEACVLQGDCANNSMCLVDFGSEARCRAMCDDAHPCTRPGETCKSISNISGLVGFCQPSPEN